MRLLTILAARFFFARAKRRNAAAHRDFARAESLLNRYLVRSGRAA
ncbi:MAG TPA: hypothetical protein VGN97_15605 [Mesorhizobium sp.]|jgi:hypothetical protein|nr:hypothetical protein [Mesorhizobium sp.]